MPKYDYACEACSSAAREYDLPMEHEPPRCETCYQPQQRLWHPVNVPTSKVQK